MIAVELRPFTDSNYCQDCDTKTLRFTSNFAGAAVDTQPHARRSLDCSTFRLSLDVASKVVVAQRNV